MTQNKYILMPEKIPVRIFSKPQKWTMPENYHKGEISAKKFDL